MLYKHILRKPVKGQPLWGLLLALATLCASEAHSQQITDCPPPEQPVLSKRLDDMIRSQRADDAFQCIISITEREKDAPAEYPDEVRYQLASQASNAIFALSEDGAAPSSFHTRTSRLWQSYLDKVSPPYDRARFSFAITKLLQHGAFASFDEYLPTIATAMNRGRAWVTPAQADQLFTTLKRCPAWRRTSGKPANACSPPCPDAGKALLSKFAADFSQSDWNASEGTRRLAVNAKAYEGSLTCGK